MLVENLYESFVNRKEKFEVQFDDGTFGTLRSISKGGDWSISGKPRWIYTIIAGAGYRPPIKAVKGIRVKVRRIK
jgi:hypothetical protein